ncbi:hypothetical protein SADUNF_Sadunf19G0012400 [Salix dunnii]|uniref:Probable magnesium transporter n=1 Tax=Salix dunnii TaxID=1413687 RepID=A0A835MHB7_9ROSI|nr:hypothetical protein SADUNF_Sadunf19G0012400 [Salix dunnii]
MPPCTLDNMAALNAGLDNYNHHHQRQQASREFVYSALEQSPDRAFIGSSFIIKKKGLRKAGVSGPRASVGGYGYLLEPLWWLGMITSKLLLLLLFLLLFWLFKLHVVFVHKEFILDIFGMIVGEVSNFVAYVYAPAVLVTPLGALSIIVSAVLAHFLLREKLQKMGVLGCLLCIVGSTVIVLHAPEERSINSVKEIWELAIQPAFLLYTASAVAIALVLILYFSPRYGQTNILVYIGICSVIGSLTVMSIKAIGIAIKLSLEGTNQAKYFQTWIFAMVAITCIITQLNYLNMCYKLVTSALRGMKLFGPLAMDNGLEYALDTFNTAIVSPIYYAGFTSFTILASAIMFKDYSGQSASSIVSELCGFVTVLSGTFILHSTREPDPPILTDLYTPLSPKVSWYIQSNGEHWKQKDEEGPPPNFITILRQDHFK